MTSSSPGKVFVRGQSDTPQVTHNIPKEPWPPDITELPDIVPPRGLSAERQWYLHEQIRPFCPDDDKDSVCPLPSVPKPGSRQGTPIPDQDMTEPQAPQPNIPKEPWPPDIQGMSPS